MLAAAMKRVESMTARTRRHQRLSLPLPITRHPVDALGGLDELHAKTVPLMRK